MTTSAAGILCDGNTGQILLRFLQRRAELSMPIESIVCSPENAGALLPEALALVDSVEPGQLGIWGNEPLFPKRMIPLLGEHLDYKKGTGDHLRVRPPVSPQPLPLSSHKVHAPC
jgi:hypothetical protein